MTRASMPGAFVQLDDAGTFGLGPCDRCDDRPNPAVMVLSYAVTGYRDVPLCHYHSTRVCFEVLSDGRRRCLQSTDYGQPCSRHNLDPEVLTYRRSEHERLRAEVRALKDAHALILERLRSGAPYRDSVSVSLRERIIVRDHGRCRYCLRYGHRVLAPVRRRVPVGTKGRRQRQRRYVQVDPDDRPWHIDHVRPVVRGGPSTEDNLVLSCAACNLRKGARALEPATFR